MAWCRPRCAGQDQGAQEEAVQQGEEAARARAQGQAGARRGGVRLGGGRVGLPGPPARRPPARGLRTSRGGARAVSEPHPQTAAGLGMLISSPRAACVRAPSPRARAAPPRRRPVIVGGLPWGAPCRRWGPRQGLPAAPRVLDPVLMRERCTCGRAPPGTLVGFYFRRTEHTDHACWSVFPEVGSAAAPNRALRPRIRRAKRRGFAASPPSRSMLLHGCGGAAELQAGACVHGGCGAACAPPPGLEMVTRS